MRHILWNHIMNQYQIFLLCWKWFEVLETVEEDIEKICEIGLQNNVTVVLDEVAGGFGVYRA